MTATVQITDRHTDKTHQYSLVSSLYKKVNISVKTILCAFAVRGIVKKTGEVETDKNSKQRRISQRVSYPQMLNTDINLLSFLV